MEPKGVSHGLPSSETASTKSTSVLLNPKVFQQVLGKILTDPDKAVLVSKEQTTPSNQVPEKPPPPAPQYHSSRIADTISATLQILNPHSLFTGLSRSTSPAKAAASPLEKPRREQQPGAGLGNLSPVTLNTQHTSFPKQIMQTLRKSKWHLYLVISMNKEAKKYLAAFKPGRNWSQFFLDRHGEYMEESGRRDITTLAWLLDEDIDRAIGIVWLTLWRQDRRCAYPMSNAVALCHDRPDRTPGGWLAWRFPGRDQSSMMMVITGAGSNFARIEPRTKDEFTNKSYSQEKSMHHVLAIAELVDPTNGDEVDITVYDSFGSHPAAFDRAQFEVENCGWLETNEAGEPVQHRVKVRRKWDRKCVQQEGAKCGLHVILNAWVCNCNTSANAAVDSLLLGHL